MKILSSIVLTFFYINAYSLEVIRDPIFENYFKNLQIQYKLPDSSVYIIKNNKINAFVIDSNIYFTTELLKNIKNEEVLKSIYFHEVGHVYHNHYDSKKLSIKLKKNNQIYSGIFSVGAAIFTGNHNIGIATSLSLDQSILNELSIDSIRFEIQADNFMLEIIRKNNINTESLINFFDKLPENSNNFFKSHPSNKDRIILLKKYLNNKKIENTEDFEWIKAKYYKDSNILEFNDFFESLDNGIINSKKIKTLKFNEIANYEIYKRGLITQDIDKMFTNIIENNSNPYLKIEFYNTIIDRNKSEYFFMIDKNKHSKEMQNEYFFHFLYGKYYNKINNIDLSSFYFCQFYKKTNLKKKIDYYCNKYDMKKVPKVDKSYAIFK